MWLMFAVGISIGMCIGVACMATSDIVEGYLDELKEKRKSR